MTSRPSGLTGIIKKLLAILQDHAENPTILMWVEAWGWETRKVSNWLTRDTSECLNLQDTTKQTSCVKITVYWFIIKRRLFFRPWVCFLQCVNLAIFYAVFQGFFSVLRSRHLLFVQSYRVPFVIHGCSSQSTVYSPILLFLGHRTDVWCLCFSHFQPPFPPLSFLNL